MDTYKIGICEGSLLPLGCSDDQSGEKSISLWCRDRLRNDPQCFSSFLNYCSWMFPERLRNKSELVGSEETRQVLRRHPRYETLSYWILLRISWLLSLRSPQNLGDVILSRFSVKRVLCSTVSSTFGCFSRNCC